MAAIKTTGQRNTKTTATAKKPTVKNDAAVVVKPDHIRITIRVSKHSDPLLYNEIAALPAFHRSHRFIRLAASGLTTESMVNSNRVLEHVERFNKIDAEFLTKLIQQKKGKQARKSSKKMAKQTGEQQ